MFSINDISLNIKNQKGFEKDRIELNKKKLNDKGYEIFELADSLINITDGKHSGGSDYPISFNCLYGISSFDDIVLLQQHEKVKLYPLGIARDIEIYLSDNEGIYLVDTEFGMYCLMGYGSNILLKMIKGLSFNDVKLESYVI